MDLLECIKKATYLYFLNFIKYLKIDNDIYSHLFEVPIKVAKIDNNISKKQITTLAIYDSDRNDITIEGIYYKDILNRLNKLIDSLKDQLKEKELLNDLCQTLCHELLHANRVLMINNRLNITNYAEKQSNIVERYKLQKEGYDINNCRLLLSDIINNKGFSNYQLVPFKVNILEYELKILTYNREKKWYEEYLIDKRKIKEFTLKEIANYLYNYYERPTKVFNIYDNVDNNECFPFAYYEEYDLNKLKLNPFEFDMYLKKKYNEDTKLLIYQESLEEELVDTIADIIINFTGKLDETIELLLINKRKNYSEVEILKLFKIHPEIITWFITSIYQEEYKNYIYELFKDNYYIFAKNIHKISISNYKKLIRTKSNRRLYQSIQ